jgi:sigma-B regulation protein RsbU (phosphoserine phosphatase)
MVSILKLRGTILEQGERLGGTAARNSQAALTDQVRQQILSLARDKAALTDEKLAAIQNQTKLAAEVATRIYTYKNLYQPKPWRYLLTRQEGMDSVFLMTAPGISPANIENEISMAANIIDVLRQATAEDLGLSACYIGGESGYFIVADKASPTPYDHRTRSWYIGAKEKGGIFWTDIFLDNLGRGAGISCAMPFYDLSNGGRIFKGVAGSGTLLSVNVNKIIDSTKIGDSGFAFLLNSKGQVIATPRRSDVIVDEKGNIFQDDYLQNSNPALGELAQRMMHRESGIMELEMEGQAVYAAYYPLQILDWSLGVVVAVDEVIAPALRIQQDILLLTDREVARIDRSIMMIVLAVLIIIILATVIIVLVAIRLSNSLTAPIVALSADAEIIGAGDLNHRLEVKTGDEIETLAKTFNQMIGSIKEITGEKERIGTELNVATRIQARMLPCIFPPFPDRKEFDIYARMQPAKEVGGDFYDFFFTSQDKLMLVIADVSGKGVPAALFMVIAKTLIKNHGQMRKPLDEILFTVNNQLCENNDESMFVTVFACLLDVTTGVLSFANAGHNKPLIARSGGTYEFLELKRGLPLGVAPDFPYVSSELTLSEGDKLYLYTDGINEAENPQEDQFGNERLRETANSCRELAPRDFDEALRRCLAEFVNGAEQSDDITSLALVFTQKKV